MSVLEKSTCKKLERKREQNRIAQQQYRRNQKRKMIELEAAVAAQSAMVWHDASGTAVSPEVPASQSEIEVMPLQIGAEDFLCDEEVQWPVEASLDNPEHAKTPTGCTHGALHRAVLCGNFSMATLLIDHGARVSTKDSLGNTALHLAVEVGSEDIVRLLLDRGADLNATNVAGETALFPAVLTQHEGIVKTIVDSGADLNVRDFQGRVALYIAVEKGSELIVNILLANGADINS